MTTLLIGWSWLTTSYDHNGWALIAVVIVICVSEIAWFAHNARAEMVKAEDATYAALRTEGMGETAEAIALTHPIGCDCTECMEAIRVCTERSIAAVDAALAFRPAEGREHIAAMQARNEAERGDFDEWIDYLMSDGREGRR